jgi:hypothetical protein
MEDGFVDIAKPEEFIAALPVRKVIGLSFHPDSIRSGRVFQFSVLDTRTYPKTSFMRRRVHVRLIKP